MMGQCLCKEEVNPSSQRCSFCADNTCGNQCPGCCPHLGNKRSSAGILSGQGNGIGSAPGTQASIPPSHSSSSGRSVPSGSRAIFEAMQSMRLEDPELYYKFNAEHVDDLVLQTLRVVRTLVGNDSEPPSSMVRLHNVAENEDGWLLVVKALVNSIPMDDPLGPAVISLLLDDCPLPTKENACQLSEHLSLSSPSKDVKKQRNICIVLGCLAEKLAGQNSTVLLNDQVMDFLMSNLSMDVDPRVCLYSIIALEKFAQTSENKLGIQRRFKEVSSGRGGNDQHPLVLLEPWKETELFERRQVGFCAQWSLDNIFLVEGRPFGYESVQDSVDITVILNSYDVSEYLKIAPSGLEARCDASSFESVRSTFQVDKGKWYFEVTLITEGVMQIGWATKKSKFLNHEGYGIGDDEYSVAYDGCRQVMWYAALSEAQPVPPWHPGDVLGTYLDLDSYEILFFLNGQLIKSHNQVFKHTTSGFFAAGSFMSFQQCRFNFGGEPFKYPPPGKSFCNFNDYGKFGDDESRIVLPRHLRMEYLRKVSVKENTCHLCFDQIASVTLLPCQHSGFCTTCADQLDTCPLCRHSILDKLVLFD